MDSVRAYVGLDVHKDTISVAIADAGRARRRPRRMRERGDKTGLGDIAKSRQDPFYHAVLKKWKWLVAKTCD